MAYLVAWTSICQVSHRETKNIAAQNHRKAVPARGRSAGDGLPSARCSAVAQVASSAAQTSAATSAPALSPAVATGMSVSGAPRIRNAATAMCRCNHSERRSVSAARQVKATAKTTSG